MCLVKFLHLEIFHEWINIYTLKYHKYTFVYYLHLSTFVSRLHQISIKLFNFNNFNDYYHIN